MQIELSRIASDAAEHNNRSYNQNSKPAESVNQIMLIRFMTHTISVPTSNSIG